MLKNEYPHTPNSPTGADGNPPPRPGTDDKATFPETHLSDPNYGWGPPASLESPQQPLDAAASLENAWLRITNRVEWISGQFVAMRSVHAQTKSRYSYIKVQAIILSIRVALAALDALSELIPA